MTFNNDQIISDLLNASEGDSSLSSRMNIVAPKLFVSERYTENLGHNGYHSNRGNSKRSTVKSNNMEYKAYI